MGEPVLSMAGQKVAVTWGNTDTDDTDQTLIANISLSSNSFGTWLLLASFAGGVVVQDSGVLQEGIMNLASVPWPYPEPATLALFALAGPILLFRR